MPLLVLACLAAGAAVGWSAAPAVRRYGPVRRGVLAAVTAAVFAALAWRPGAGADLPAFLYLGAAGTLLGFVDAAVKRLPDALTLPSYAVGALALGAAALGEGRPGRLAGAAFGAFLLWAVYAAQHALAPNAIGRGDVKLAGVLGLYLGWLGHGAWLTGLLAGFFIGGGYALALLVTRRASRGTEIPFGPFMLLGALTGILLG